MISLLSGVTVKIKQKVRTPTGRYVHLVIYTKHKQLIYV